MIRLLDWYIIRKFIGTFFYSIALILIVVIVFDISEKTQDFIDRDPPLKAIVFDYYLNFVPYFANLFSPLFVFIAVIFFTSRMAYRTEIVAILSSGISFNRLLFPYMIGATIIATLSLFLNLFIIPHANRDRLEFEEIYIRNKVQFKETNIHRQISPGVFYYMQGFSTYNNIGFKFSLEKFSNNQLVYKLNSEFIQWDSLKNKWTIHNYYIRELGNGVQEKIRKGDKLDTTLNIDRKEFYRRTNSKEMMTAKELDEFISSEKMKGAGNVEEYELEKYQRISFPFATYILTLIGVALASRKVRGGIGLHIGVGLLISFGFILFMQFSSVFAKSGIVSPLIAAWIPNAIFIIIAILLLRLAPK